MGLVAVFLALGIVVAIAALFVIREAGRIAREPPAALFDTEDALEWVTEHLPDDVAATLTVDDVRRILDLQLEFLERRGVAGNGKADKPARSPSGEVVFGDPETIAYILDRAASDGESYLPEQVHAVVDIQLRYLRSIGAVGPPAPPAPET